MKTQVVLTVSASKRLIGRAVAQMDIVQKAKKDGILVVSGGTTDGYLAEELLGHEIDKRAFRYGITTPHNPERKGGPAPQGRKDLIFRNGQIDESVDRITIVPDMKRGDVYVKGANALDYRNKVAGILIENPTGGTVGASWGRIYGSHMHIVIPVGLEKVVYHDIFSLARKTMDPDYMGPSLYPVTGIIVTEIEALKMLSGVDAELLASGGIAGAEGSVRLLLEGEAEVVKKALALVESVRDEPRFLM
ncbi:MAG: hypothetical protein M1370_10790 [Bacteroidetes bacterium]|nr:hypothetical protein [Bacteroidota bacterium]MCL5025711.1 hypothetical protein [Chloroflexota bacterium]